MFPQNEKPQMDVSEHVVSLYLQMAILLYRIDNDDKPVLHPNPYFQGAENTQGFAGNLGYYCTPLNFYGFGSSRYGI